MKIDKSLVSRHFNNGLQSYNSHALIQHDITSKLIHMVLDLGYKDFSKAFEVGCGSGFLTRRLIENLLLDKLVVNDIACFSQKHIEDISHQYSQEIEFVCGDAEHISLPQNNNAIFSSSTLQWFNSLSSFFEKVNTNLIDKGLFAFSTFGIDNFREIKSLTGIGLEYHPLETLETLLSENFTLLAKKEWRQVLEFKHPINVLQHMKKTGVNGIKKNHLGISQMSQLTKDYCSQFSTPNNTVTLTYHPIIIIARKK